MKKILSICVVCLLSAATTSGQDLPQLKVTERDMTGRIFRCAGDNETVVEIQSNVPLVFETNMDKEVSQCDGSPREKNGFFWYELKFPTNTEYKKYDGRKLTIQSVGYEYYIYPLELKAKISVGLLVTSETKRQADDFYDAGDYKEALKAYEKLRAINPKDDFIGERIADCKAQLSPVSLPNDNDGKSVSNTESNIDNPSIEVTKGPNISKYPKKTFVEANFSWSPQPQMAYGLTIGQFKRLGWYVSFMSNFQFTQFNSELSLSDVNESYPIEDQYGNKYDVYVTVGNTSTTRISATAGFIGKISPTWAMYVGTGFGYRALFWEVTGFNKEKSDPEVKEIETGWARNSYYSTLGVDVEGGFLFDIKGFTLSTAIITTNFERFDIKVGMGFAIRHKTKNIF